LLWYAALYEAVFFFPSFHTVVDEDWDGRWVPQVAEFDACKPVLHQLLQMTTGRVLQSMTLDSGGFTEGSRLAVNQTSLLVR
jgi:hypothetical protein